jgi:uncharacterized membrane protein YczE
MNPAYEILNIRRNILRYLALFSGLFIIANGIVFTINADLGVNPWDVFHIGLANQTGITIGRVMQGVGLLLIAVSYFLKVRLYIGTILNMIFLGLFVDLIIGWGYVFQPDLLWQRILLYLIGVVIFGFGVAVYISANLGAGPRDSLMLALTKASRFRVGTIRTFMEVTVAAIGFLLGGPLGIGTVIFALSIGLFMEMGFTLVRQFKKTAIYTRIWYG